MKHAGIFSALLIVLLSSCGSDNNADAYSSQQGNTFVAEKNIQPYMESVLVAYSGFRPEHEFNPKYMREVDLLNTFFADKTPMVVMSRDLDSSERKHFRDLEYAIRSEKIILGAIAFLSPLGEDSTYTEKEIMELLTTNDPNSPKILFDEVQSANFNYFDRLLKSQGKKFGNRVKCLHSNKEVINYMKSNKNCIGVIGYNWISDVDDKAMMKSMEKVQLLQISKNSSSNYCIPTQYYVYEREYPFIHYWYIHYHGSKKGALPSLINYIINEKGQLIAKKDGLQPYYKIAREFYFIYE